MIALMPKTEFEKPAGYKNINTSCMLKIAVKKVSVNVSDVVTHTTSWMPAACVIS